ncbi:MAG: hypothetical protein ABI831_16395, partial [Betaproteobacteria bacterium]
GLPYGGGIGAGTTPPAVDLFGQRARQAYLGFSLDAELPHVVRICELVEGLPLGIEIAAAWVRTIPCGDIAVALEREAAKLRSVHRNRPQRHQSLDAVINYSWQLLTDEQQRALASLGLFVGGFTRDAAEMVAQAPLRTLSTLVDKALVRRGSEGRYDLHELVRQFAFARLRAARAREKSTTRRYAAFYCDLLLAIDERSRGPDELAANVGFRTELPNVLGCFRRCLAESRVDVIERIAPPLVRLLHTQGLVHEALKVAEEAACALEATGRNGFLGQLRLQWGRAAITGGQPDAARRQLELALQGATRDQPEVVAACLYYRGGFLYQQGDIEAAQRDADDATRLAAGSENQELRSMCFNLQGSLANMHARFDVAEAELRKGLAAAREQGTPSLIAVLLCGLAVPLYYQGRLPEAALLTREAAALSEQLGKTPNAIFARGNLAVIELAMGQIEPARQEAETAVRLARHGGSDSALSGCLATLGEILLKAGRLREARAAAAEGQKIASAVGNTLQETHAQYVLVGIELRDGRRNDACEHLLAMHAALARHRLVVRVPLLILAAADWALTLGASPQRLRAACWLRALVRQDGIDSAIRKDACAMIEREGAMADPAKETATATSSLAEVEAEVAALIGELASPRSAGES